MTASWRGRTVVVLSPTPTHPLDAGNRRRIYFLTLALKDAGARIVFLHYPSEREWRADVPQTALAAMSAQWHEHHIIPVTAQLHPNSRGQDHLADEWWDPAIGHMLDWVFRTHTADVCIVNYTWLSRAFEHCPPGVLRVLDTHDRFSGRRELLRDAGIGPEFFHTTEAEERLALARAHVVWSIKPQEAAFFTSLGIGTVINMPFLEPSDPTPAIRPGAIPRFGFVGAANSINRVNAEAFLAAIRAYVDRTLLPCEIIVAGSICDLLPPPDVPWIKLLGRLPDLKRFYEAVDVVLAPITFSTGLKIKVGEALCHGKAVLALAHAFEGYPARHPFHTLPSLDAMMAAMRSVVNAPAMVRELERCSVLAVRDLEAQVAGGLDRTIAELGRVSASVCFVMLLDELFEGSPVLDNVMEAAHYLGHIAPVRIFVDGAPDAAWAAAPFHLLWGMRFITVADHPGHAATAERLRALGFSRPATGSLDALASAGQMAFWFATGHCRWQPPSAPHPILAYLHLDAALAHATTDEVLETLSLLSATFGDVVTLSRRGLDPGWNGTRVCRSRRVPSQWRGERSRALGRLRENPRHDIVILADDADDPLLALTLAVVARLSRRRVGVMLPYGASLPDDILASSSDHGFGIHGVLPVLAIDISTSPGLECAREVFDRSDIPCLTLFSEAEHGQSEPAPTGMESGLFASVALLADVLGSPTAGAALVERRGRAGDYRNDAGWAALWVEIGELCKMTRVEVMTAEAGQ